MAVYFNGHHELATALIHRVDDLGGVSSAIAVYINMQQVALLAGGGIENLFNVAI